MKLSIKYLFFFTFIVLTVACSDLRKVSTSNLSDLYSWNATTLHPDFRVYHNNDSTSRLYFKINTSELLYTKKENTKLFTTKVKIKYRLFESFNAKIVLDSASVILSDSKTENKKTALIGHFNIKIKPFKNYILELTTTDIYRSSQHKTYLLIDKNNPFNKQNFLLTNDQPIFTNYVTTNEKIQVTHKNAATKKLYGRHYNRDFPIAAPPFSLYASKPFDYKADSLFQISTKDTVINFQPISEGIYHLQIDTISKEGLTLFNFGGTFPELGATTDLIYPLRYITTKREYSDLLESKNQKETLDKFWLRLANNAGRAKELIRNYYTRVENANRYFTSYIEGWKTDRGMIYIVFGPPNVIYKSNNGESWVYGEEGNIMSVNFSFTKVQNPFSDNDFNLNRSTVYKGNYYKAVDAWREGRVFSN